MADATDTRSSSETQQQPEAGHPADAPERLLQLWDRYSADQRAWERREAFCSTNEELYRFVDQQDDLILAMLDTPATTAGGVASKLKVALLECDEELHFTKHLLLDGPEPGRMDVTRQDNLIWSAIRDLERMAAAGDAS